MNDIQAQLIEIKRDIRDLKTAQFLPGLSTMQHAIAILPAGDYNGVYTWTIYYEDVGSTNAPLTYSNPGDGFTLLPYDSDTNTQKLEWYRPDGYDWPAGELDIFSSRGITSVGPITKEGNI